MAIALGEVMDFNDSLIQHVETFLSALQRHNERRAASATSAPITRPSESPRRSNTQSVWLTVEEAVQYLGLQSRMALYQAVRRGQVPVHHFGRRLRFRRPELDAALDRR